MESGLIQVNEENDLAESMVTENNSISEYEDLKKLPLSLIV